MDYEHSKVERQAGGERDGGGSQNLSRQWILDEFGFDIELIGNCTPQQANELARQSKALAQQLEIAKAIAKHAKEIMKNKKEIERIRAEAVEVGLSDKEEVDKYVRATVLRSAIHQEHIKKMMQDTTQGVQLIQTKSGLSLQASHSKFQDELRVAQARYQQTLKGQKTASDRTLNGMQEAEGEAQERTAERQKFSDYINGRDTKSQGKGFWGGLFK